jgi:hypothetical protein
MADDESDDTDEAAFGDSLLTSAIARWVLAFAVLPTLEYNNDTPCMAVWVTSWDLIRRKNRHGCCCMWTWIVQLAYRTHNTSQNKTLM